jgi:hypothetical protein
MTTVYRKSVKGQHEIETRANRLAPRLRTALILVDGRRTDADLRTLIQTEPDAALLALLEADYIEVVSAQLSSPPTLPAAPWRPAAEFPPVPAVASAAVNPAAFAERRRAVVRHLTDQLGPVAETVALRIEKARNWEELRPALDLGLRLLQTARGSGAAAQFAARFIDTPLG